MKIDIISRELIKPSSPTPSHLKNFKLSFLDQLVPSSYFSIILHYSYDQTKNTTQAEISHYLKTSLSDVLTQFYPLAGKVNGDDSVECDDSGVGYIETRIDTELKSIIDCPQVDVLDKLIPYQLDVEQQLVVQINFFICGGIAIGMCINHRLADASSLTTFIRDWAAMSRGAKPKYLDTPLFVTSSLFPPQILSKTKRIPKKASAGEPPVTKRFVFSTSAIAKLREKMAGENPRRVPCTRVEAISALIWKCCLETNGKYMVAFHIVNVRSRLVPALPENTFGNVFLMAKAVANGETGLSLLAGKLRGAIEEISGDCLVELLGENGFGVLLKNYGGIGKLMLEENVELLRFSSWCRFRVYEADFGWGKPVWVSMGSTPDKGAVFFLDSSSDDGGIEVWLVLDKESMAKFELHPDLLSFVA